MCPCRGLCPCRGFCPGLQDRTGCPAAAVSPGGRRKVTLVKVSTRQVAVAGLLGALTIALGLTPLGFVPVPTPAGSATTMHIPAIIAGVVEGPAVGAAVGAIFGSFSFYRAQTSANPVARMMFTDPLVAFVPRILIGVVAWAVFWLCMRGARVVGGSGRTGRILFAVGLGAVFAHTGYLFALEHGVLALPGQEPVPLGQLVSLGLGLAVGVLVGLAVWKVLSARAGAVGLAALAGSLTNTVGVLGLSVLRGYLPGPAALAVGILHGVPEMLVASVLTVLVYRGLSGPRLTPRRAASL